MEPSTAIPSYKPSFEPSAAPSYEPTYGILIVQSTQAVSGVSVDIANTALFQTDFVQTVADTLSVSSDVIKINSITAKTSRRRSLLATGVYIMYTVTTKASTTVSVLTSLMTTAISDGTFTTSLHNYGYGAATVVDYPVTVDLTPTSTPTRAPSPIPTLISPYPTVSPTIAPSVKTPPTFTPSISPSFSYPPVLLTGGYINAYAGSVTGCSGSTPIAATSAQIHKPGGMAFNRYGEMYFTDAANNCIRKVSNGTKSSGFIATVAVGACTSSGPYLGYTGDNGPATSAKLNLSSHVIDVEVDRSGNIYFPDFGNNVIRYVKISTGIITTLVGKGGVSGTAGDNGPASLAQFFSPISVWIDPTATTLTALYIADWQNHAIRKYTFSNKVVTTIAGTLGINGYDGKCPSSEY